jgi:hypothetical protein
VGWWVIDRQRIDNPGPDPPRRQDHVAPAATAAAPVLDGPATSPAAVLALQRLVGNRAVAGLFRQGHDHDGDAGTPPQKPAASTLRIGEYDVPVGADAQRRAMEDLIVAKGRDGPRQFAHDARMALDRATPSAGIADNPEHLAQVKAALDALDPVIAQLEKEYDALEPDFETAARDELVAILDDSKKRTEAEAFRYGLTMTDIKKTEDSSAGSHEVTSTEYEMKEGTQAKAGIAEAAKQLLQRQAAMQPLKDRVAKLKASYNISGEASGGLAPKPEGYDEAIAELDAENLRYEALITQLAGEYPAIDAVARSNPAGLQAIATGTAKDAATVIGPQIKKRYADIERVRNAKDTINVFKIPKVVAMTKTKLKVDGSQWKDKVIDDTVAHAHEKDELLDTALAVVNLALVMLAPVTGGASLIAAAGVSSVGAAMHMQEYMLQDAMAGSDLEKAKALSQTEPSLLWLAVEVVAALADAGAAAKTASRLLGAYRPVEDAVKAARAAKAAEEVEAATKRVEQACRDASGDALAKKVLAGMERDGAIATGVSKEVRAVDTAAARAAEQELKGAATAATERGHVHVSERGVVYSCESPCLEVRNKYAGELTDANNKDLLTELEGIEADRVKLGKSATDAQTKGIARRAAALDDKFASRVLKQRAAKLAEALPGIHPVFQTHQLDAAAVERIIRRKEISHMKGQLMEELVTVEIEKQLTADPAKFAGRALKEGEKPILIRGDRIRDAEGSFTDGMIVIQHPDGIEVLAIIESKAGASSAVELKGVKESLDKLYNVPLHELNPEGVRNAAARRIDNLRDDQLASLIDELRTLRMEGIDSLKASNPARFEALTSAEIDLKHRALVTRQVRKLPKTREGQLLHDTERLAEAERLGRKGPQEGQRWQGLKIDDEPVKVLNRGRPKVVAGLPEGMEEESFGKRIGSTPDPKDPNKVKGDLLDVSVVKGPLAAEELDTVAKKLSELAKAPAP